MEEILRGTSQAIRKDIQQWFAKTMPGAFSQAGATPPSCELLILSKGDKSEEGSNLIDLLSMNRIWASYQPTGWPGAQLQFLEVNNAATLQCSLVVERSALSNFDTEGYGSDRLALPSLAKHAVGALLQQAAALGLLEISERRLSHIRDLGLHERGGAARRLRELEDLTRESFDLFAVARDLQGLDGQWDDDGVRWTSPRPGEHDIDLGRNWSTWIVERSRALLDLDSALKALLLQHGNLLAARQNLRLQRFVWVLAIITGALTLVTAIEPGFKAYRTAEGWVSNFASETLVAGRRMGIFGSSDTP